MHGARLDVRARRVGLVVGGTTSGMFETEQLLARLHAEPECREVLVGMLSHPLTSTGDRLDERLGPFARIRTLSSACSSGANALVVAAAWLLAGDVDAVVAGGSDGLCRLTLERIQCARRRSTPSRAALSTAGGAVRASARGRTSW